MPENSDETRNQRTTSKGALESTLEDLRGSLCRSGIGEESWDRQEVEWQILIECAETKGLVLPADFLPPEFMGGREHDVRHVPATQECPAYWIKYTKASAAGYTVEWNGIQPYLLPARPSQYLQRLIWQNLILGDTVQLLGLWQSEPRQWHIVTTQEDYPFRMPEEDELIDVMQNLGASLLPWRGVGYDESLSFELGGYALWDIRIHNLTVSESGLPHIFDAIISKMPETD